MHADDNNGRIVYASDNGMGTVPYTATSPAQISNNNAWTWSKLNFITNNPYNWDPAADITLRPLWPYTGKDTNLFKCPSDRSSVVVNGQARPRVRSVSMNLFMGGFAGDPNSASLFAGASPTNRYFQLYLKIAEISVPGKIFVFLDERSDTINWGCFATDMSGYLNIPGAYRFNVDLPGFYHDQSCTFSFVDGHVEEKRWLDTMTTPAPLQGLLVGGKGSGSTFPAPYDPDVAWLQDHATRPK